MLSLVRFISPYSQIMCFHCLLARHLTVRMLHNLLRQIFSQAIKQAAVFLKIALCLTRLFILLMTPCSRVAITLKASFIDLR